MILEPPKVWNASDNSLRIAKAPLRVSFAGGGTDLPSFYEREEWGAVCSMAIDKYVYVVAKPLPELFPYRYKLAYSRTELCNEIDDIAHPIIREVLRSHKIPSLDLASFADIPAGTGLGSSSAFTVALEALLGGIENAAERACTIEIDRLREPIGKQDQLCSAKGSLGYHIFKRDGSVTSNCSRNDPSNACCLFYVGGSRSASETLSRQSSNPNVEILKKMRVQAIQAADAINAADYRTLGKIVSEGWELKKQLTYGITTPEIDSLIHSALQAGAWGAKLLGAGGTGFILVVADPANFDKIGLAMGRKPISIQMSKGVSVESL